MNYSKIRQLEYKWRKNSALGRYVLLFWNIHLHINPISTGQNQSGLWHFDHKDTPLEQRFLKGERASGDHNTCTDALLLWFPHHPRSSNLSCSCTACSQTEVFTEVAMLILFWLSLHAARPPLGLYGQHWVTHPACGDRGSPHLHHTALCLSLSSPLSKSLAKADSSLKCFPILCFPQSLQRDRLLQRAAQSTPLFICALTTPLQVWPFSTNYMWQEGSEPWRWVIFSDTFW